MSLNKHQVPLASLLKRCPEIAVEWGSDRSSKTITAKSDSFSRLAGNSAQGVIGGKMVHSLRSVGSAALNYALVAQGGLDLYWWGSPVSLSRAMLIDERPSTSREIGCWPWDVCAGIVIAEEAGGVVTGSHDVFAATSESDAEFGDVTEEILTGRKYIVVRAIADSPVSLRFYFSAPLDFILTLRCFAGRERIWCSKAYYQRVLRQCRRRRGELEADQFETTYCGKSNAEWCPKYASQIIMAFI